MRRSPRRPLILKRRKLPFQQSEPPASQDASVPQENPGSSSACQSFPDGVRILDHPHLPGTQVVVIPKTAELRSVIEALTVKGKEHGAQGPNKFILLGESGSLDSGSLEKTDQDSGLAEGALEQQLSQSSVFTGVKQRKKEDDDGRFNNSLTNIEWLERCDALLSGPSHDKSNKENQTAAAVLEEAAPPVREAACGSAPKKSGDCPQGDTAMKPPFSYMTMIQFAINSTKDGLMTLKEIYTWLEHHFDFFRAEKRQGWKNSVRHNLSLHKMFLRKTSPDKKVSFWTIRPEANRGLTLDQVYTPGCNPVAASFALPAMSSPRQQKTPPVSKKARTGSGSAKRMKPILPQMPTFQVPIQLTLGASICLPSSSMPGPPAPAPTPAPALAPAPAPAPTPARHTDSSPCKAKRRRNIPKVALLRDAAHRSKAPKAEMREEVACVTPQRGSPMTLARRRQAGSSRRKQRLVRKQHEEPLLLYTQTSDLDSSVVAEPELQERRLHSYKTPIKAGRRLASSTPSKPLAELTGQSTLDFSPIRSPLRDHTSFSVSPTPFKDWALFPDTGIACSGEPLLAGGGGSPPANRSLSEGLVLDTTNDSLSKILVDFSFSLDDMHELGLSDVSLSELMPQLA